MIRFDGGFSPTAKNFLNNVFNIGLENLNRIAKNTKAHFQDSIIHKTAISDLVKGAIDITVVKDDTLAAKVHFYNTYFMIDRGRIASIVKLSYDPVRTTR
jgi:hypothetical protein